MGEKIMKRLYFKEKTGWEYEGREREPVWKLSGSEEKKKIAVIGISRGAGATFVSMSLAFLLSKYEETGRRTGRSVSAAYVEMRQPAPGEAGSFFQAGLDLRFRGNRFTDFFAEYMAGRTLPVSANLYGGVNWVAWRNTEAEAYRGAWKNDGAAAFPMHQIQGKWIVADQPPLESLHRFDVVLAVLDPLPSSIYAGAETYEILRGMADCGKKTHWIVNRDNMHVNHGELERFLRLGSYEAIPLLDSSIFFRAQYAGCLPAELLAADYKNKRKDSEKNDPAYEALEELVKEITADFDAKEKNLDLP